MDTKILSVWSLLLGIFLLLPSCAGTRVVKSLPANRAASRISYVTRSLISEDNYAYVETTEHGQIISDTMLVEFFARNPELNGRITRSDYLFLLDLSREAELRTLLEQSPDSPPEQGIDFRVSVLERKISGIQHEYSEASRRGAYSESWEQIDSTNPVDRIKIALLLQSLGCVEFRKELVQFLIADILDISTEIGGAVMLSDRSDCPLSLQQIPSQGSGDYEYRPPSQLLSSSCVAIWHNHAATDEVTNPQDANNSPQAGPSGTLRGSLNQVGGDMWQCYIHGIDGVVITPVGGGNFNLDFVNSEGIVLDLGVYTYLVSGR